MIHLITGRVDSGKTTKMIEVYNELKCGDGFVTEKIFENNENVGQKIVRVSSRESKIFSLKLNKLPNAWDEKYRYKDYSFSENGIRFAENIANEIVMKKSQPIFFDEIGPLELNEESGLYDIFKLLLSSNMDMYIAVREKCYEQLINKFNLKEYTTIKIYNELN